LFFSLGTALPTHATSWAVKIKHVPQLVQESDRIAEAILNNDFKYLMQIHKNIDTKIDHKTNQSSTQLNSPFPIGALKVWFQIAASNANLNTNMQLRSLILTLNKGFFAPILAAQNQPESMEYNLLMVAGAANNHILLSEIAHFLKTTTSPKQENRDRTLLENYLRPFILHQTNATSPSLYQTLGPKADSTSIMLLHSIEISLNSHKGRSSIFDRNAKGENIVYYASLFKNHTLLKGLISILESNPDPRDILGTEMKSELKAVLPMRVSSYLTEDQACRHLNPLVAAAGLGSFITFELLTALNKKLFMETGVPLIEKNKITQAEFLEIAKKHNNKDLISEFQELESTYQALHNRWNQVSFIFQNQKAQEASARELFQYP
jgi:hypothetical protein